MSQTILHELHRLSTSNIGRGGYATGAAVSAETNAAAEFAERAYENKIILTFFFFYNKTYSYL
jgi:hypothetical protein